MAIVINGSGTVTGLAVGGLPDGTVDAGTLATNSVDSAELVDGAVDDSHMASISGRKNILINGDYRISQRGDYTSATSVTNGAYLLDRAKNYLVGVTGTAQQLTNQVVNGTYENTWKYVATSSASGRIGSYQLVEDWYKGETLTLSAWVKSNNANARIVVYDGATNTSSSTHTGGGAWEKLTVTATQSASAGQLYVYSAIISSSVGSVSISSSDYIETAMFQLERGSTATDFERRHTGEELALCQRYFEKSYDYATPPGTSTINSSVGRHGTAGTATSGEMFTSTVFKVEKRAAPTVLAYDTSGNVGKCAVTNYGVTEHQNEVCNEVHITTSGCHFQKPNGGNTGRAITVHYTADAEI